MYREIILAHDLINDSKQFIPVKIVEDASHDTEVTVAINDIKIKASLIILNALLGVICDRFKENLNYFCFHRL